MCFSWTSLFFFMNLICIYHESYSHFWWTSPVFIMNILQVFMLNCTCVHHEPFTSSPTFPQDKDPLGAVPLTDYMVAKALEVTRDFAFKLEKYGARTYYFAADSDESRKKWVFCVNTIILNCWVHVCFNMSTCNGYQMHLHFAVMNGNVNLYANSSTSWFSVALDTCLNSVMHIHTKEWSIVARRSELCSTPVYIVYL